MQQLRKTDHNTYLNNFAEMISSPQIAEKIEETVKENCYLQDRKNILYTALKLFRVKNYESFVYLMVPQIEGLFRLFLELIGDHSRTGGMMEIAKKIKEKEDFFEFIYFAYDFSDLRNSIAHGAMIKIGREQAFEVIMDTYWIVGEINSDERDYKLWMKFIKECTESIDSSENIQNILRYFAGLEKEKYLELLERYLKNGFTKEIKWYQLELQMAQWDQMIRDRDFYKAIWNEEPLQSIDRDMGGREKFILL